VKLLAALLVLPLLILTSCSIDTLTSNQNVSSGQPCESSDTFLENNGIEYICWQTNDNKFIWRQNREVEQELQRQTNEDAILQAEKAIKNELEYKECMQKKKYCVELWCRYLDCQSDIFID
jgi:hypothetical protein